jgi:hypothetical protein
VIPEPILYRLSFERVKISLSLIPCGFAFQSIKRAFIIQKALSKKKCVVWVSCDKALFPLQKLKTAFSPKLKFDAFDKTHIKSKMRTAILV